MSWQQLPLAHAAPQPWRNGGGLTHELLAWPSATDWSVRMSVAEVRAAGPFSAFSGVERWFAVLQGAGVHLRIGPATHVLTHDTAPLRFDGGLPVACEPIGGATLDFNLMAAPGAAQMQRLGSAPHAFSVPAARLLALYTHTAPAQVLGASGELVLELLPRHLAWTVCAAPLAGTVHAERGLWMQVTP